MTRSRAFLIALGFASGAAPLSAQVSAQMSAPSMPVVSYPSQSGRSQAVAQRDRGGHYVFRTEVNGAPLVMLFDTGASQITLRAEDAAAAGIDVGTLRYSRMADTANGRAEIAPVTINTLTVGTITRRNVPAMVARPGNLSVNLLGQSFLSRLAGYRLAGDQLILQGGE